MLTKDYSLILTTHFADHQWTLNGDDYAGLTWLSDTPKPTQKQLDDLWQATFDQVKAKADASAASRQAILDRLGITSDEAALLLS